MPISVQRIGTAADVDGTWAAVTGLGSDAALLVRPDGFVAWRAGAPPPSAEDRLGEVLRQILGRGR